MIDNFKIKISIKLNRFKGKTSKIYQYLNVAA